MAGFSKLIHADLLTSLLKSPFFTGTASWEPGALTGYSSDVLHAIAFTDDNYIVTHNHQYYTGVPVSGGSSIGLVKPYNILTEALTSGVTTTMTGWNEQVNGVNKYTIYGVQTDSAGRPFIVVDNAAGLLSHNLTFASGDESTSYNPNNDLTLTFATASDYNKFTITDSADPQNVLTVAITPAIKNNVVVDGNAKPATANNIVIFSATLEGANDLAGGDSTSYTVKDSGYKFSPFGSGSSSEAFVKDGTTGYSDVNIPTEKAIASYVSGALGEITGAMRYQGVADGSAGDWLTNNWQEVVADDEGKITTDGATNASLVSTIKYQKGDVYYVTKAGMYAGQYCEVGDMLIAKADKGENFSNADWTVVLNNWTASDNGTPIASWNSVVTLGTIGGVTLDFQMPASPKTTANYKLTGSAAIDTPDDGTDVPTFTINDANANGNAYISLYGYTSTESEDGSTTNYVSTVFGTKVQGSTWKADAATANASDLLAGGVIKVLADYTDADNSVLHIVHDTSVTENTVAGTSLYALAYDSYGHINTTKAISNKLTFMGDLANVTGKNAKNFAATDGFGGLADTTINIIGSTSTAGNGAAAGDLVIKTQVTEDNTLKIIGELKQAYRAFTFANANAAHNDDVSVTDHVYNSIKFVAGANVQLTADTDDENNVTTVTIDARDSWRSVKYYYSSVTGTTISDVKKNADDKDTESGYLDVVNSITTTAKSLGTNALNFGSEFIFKAETGQEPEVHIEWCEITADKVEFTY